MEKVECLKSLKEYVDVYGYKYVFDLFCMFESESNLNKFLIWFEQIAD